MASTTELHDRYRWRQGADETWSREADEVELFYAVFSRKRDNPEKASFPITASAANSQSERGDDLVASILSAPNRGGGYGQGSRQDTQLGQHETIRFTLC